MGKKKEIYGKKEHLKKRKTNKKTCDNIDVNEIEHFKKKTTKEKRKSVIMQMIMKKNTSKRMATREKKKKCVLTSRIIKKNKLEKMTKER